ncbi:hypothetical protein [Pseudomonas fluorescens]|uniref:hypothetical protein n=1 Tax=Pseudomonas fluorescens TaxID=294 RepID=UPI0030DC8014
MKIFLDFFQKRSTLNVSGALHWMETLMGRTERDAFEASLPHALLARAGDGYVNETVDHDWKVWQLAWLAAHQLQPLPPEKCVLKCELTKDEIEYIKNIF